MSNIENEIEGISSNDLIIILDSILNNKKGIISHHIDSMNKFNESGIKQIITSGFLIKVEMNNLRLDTEEDKQIAKYLMQANITDVRLTSPVTINYDTQKSQILYPSEAHRKDLTYSSPMFIDAEIVCKKLRSEAYQKSQWRGTGVPAEIDIAKFERSVLGPV